QDPELRPLLDDLRVAHDLSKKLTAQRRDRGSIDFDLPESKIILDDQGRVAEIVRRPRNDAHRLIEEFMLAANEAVARFFDVRGEQETYLAGVSAQCSDRERASMKAERDIASFYAALFMQDRIGEKHLAVVTGVAEFGLFCELEDLFVEGLVPAETLGEKVKLDKEMQRLVVGSSGRSYGVGDEVHVEVISADPARRRITLGLAGKVAGGEKWLKPEDVGATSSASKP